MKMKTPCILWTGHIRKDGYGQKGRSKKAHVWAWEKVNGPVPEGLELDHTCQNRACINVEHLEPVTHLENVRRGKVAEANRARAQAVTHCRAGHPYDEQNTRWVKAHRGGGQARQCRACHRERERKRRGS